MARVANHVERHEDTITFMKEIIAKNPKLTEDERDLLSSAYKNLTCKHRNTLNKIDNTLCEETIKTNPGRFSQLQNFRIKIIQELDDNCNDFINLIDNVLFIDDDPSTKVFYEKLKGDYYRYSIEFKVGPAREIGFKASKESYERAMDIAKQNLKPSNTYFLNLILNYSVFLYEIAGKKEEALILSNETIKKVSDLIEEHSRGFSCCSEDPPITNTGFTLLQLLQENVSLWNEEQDKK